MLDIVKLAEQSGATVYNYSLETPPEADNGFIFSTDQLDAYSRALLEEAVPLIATAILSRSTEGVASRIALMQRTTGGDERNLGGLNESALTETISDAIRAMLPAPTAEQEKKA